MASKAFQIIIVTVVAGAGLAGLGALQIEHTQLKRKLARQGEWREKTQRLENENRQLAAITAQSGAGAAGDAPAIAAIHAELVEARREVAALEKKARERHAQLRATAAQDENALANNRDPMRGLTRLEYFTDAGQATPATAFQTLAWAVLRNKSDRVAQLYTLSPEARTKAETLIAGLPEAARSQWTPEKLGELFLTGALTSASAIQIAEVKLETASRATLVFRIPSARGDPKLPMELGPNGWRVLVDGRGIDVVRKQIGQVDPARGGSK